MGVSHKMGQTNIVMAHTWFTMCFLITIFTKYSSQHFQQPNQQYQQQIYSQQQYLQGGNENPRNTIYEYQEDGQQISQVYDNSLNQQQDESYYQDPADTQYVYQDQGAVDPQQPPHQPAQQEDQVAEGSDPAAQYLPYPSSNAMYTPRNDQFAQRNDQYTPTNDQYTPTNDQYTTTNDQYTPQTRVQKGPPDQIQSRADIAPAQSRLSTIVSKISEFIKAFFNSEGTARNDHPGLAAILSVSSLIVASILYI